MLRAMRALVVVGVFAMGACLSIDTTDLAAVPADSGAPAPPAKETVPGACADPNAACYVVPDGWDGPYALVEERVNCPALLPDVKLTRSTDLLAPLATCRCTCGAPNGGSCGGRLEMQTSSACGGSCSGSARALPLNDCQSASSCDGAAGRYARVFSVVDSAPTCAAGSVTVEGPPFAFGRNVRACGTALPPVREACAEGRRCAPSNVATGLCITRAGDLDCPAEYPSRVLTHRTAEDQRRCGSCTCAPTNVACAGRFFVGTSKANCESNVGIESPPTGCIDFGSAGQAKFIGGTLAATCAPASPPVLEGAVVGVDPLTVCCER
jgi:hypothetical protein